MTHTHFQPFLIRSTYTTRTTTQSTGNVPPSGVRDRPENLSGPSVLNMLYYFFKHSFTPMNLFKFVVLQDMIILAVMGGTILLSPNMFLRFTNLVRANAKEPCACAENPARLRACRFVTLVVRNISASPSKRFATTHTAQAEASISIQMSVSFPSPALQFANIFKLPAALVVKSDSSMMLVSEICRRNTQPLL